MLLKSCGRCHKLMPYGSTYCSTCRPIVEAEREARLQEKIKQNKRKYNKEYNKKRDPKYVRFYNGGDWRALSAKRLSDDDYKCEWCGKVATEVDHIIAIQTPEGWERRLDYTNTRSLCHDCHDRRHGRFIKKNVLKVPKMR